MTIKHSVLRVTTFLPECFRLQMTSEETYTALTELYSKGIFPSWTLYSFQKNISTPIFPPSVLNIYGPRLIPSAVACKTIWIPQE